MGWCVGCTNNNRKSRATGITFHKFPRDSERRSLWVAAMSRRQIDWQPTAHSRLCSAHFRPEDLDRTSLCCVRVRENAVPSIFPGHSCQSSDRGQMSESAKPGKDNSSDEPTNETVPSRINCSKQTAIPLPERSPKLAEFFGIREIVSNSAADQEEEDSDPLKIPMADLSTRSTKSNERSDEQKASATVTLPIDQNFKPVGDEDEPMKRIDIFNGYVEKLIIASTTSLKRKLKEITYQNVQSRKKIKTLQQARRRLCRRNEKLAKCIARIERKKSVCAATHCNSHSDDSELSFHKFPSNDSSLLEEWLKVCIPGWTPAKGSMLCSKHFTPDCFQTRMDKRYLFNNSIPTIHGDDPSSGYQLDTCVEEETDDYIERNELNCTDSTDEPETNQICRLCTESGRKNIPIFGDHGETDLAVAEKISRCLPIIVLQTDNLPLYVCMKCLRSLNITYKLILSSIRADTLLRRRLAESSDVWDEESVISSGNNTLLTCKQPSHVSTDTKEIPVPSINLEDHLTCDLCNQDFDDMELFDHHIETIHFLRWRCNLCDDSFETSGELVTHKELSHAGQLVTCKTCVGTANTQKYLGTEVPFQAMETLVSLIREPPDTIREEKIVTKEATKCSPALTAATSKPSNTLDEMLLKHNPASNERKDHKEGLDMSSIYNCDMCEKLCENETQLDRHKKETCPKISKSNHRCKYCNKTWLSNQQLLVHLREHKKEMLQDPSVMIYKCVTCPKTFVDKSLYQKHRNVHDPECWDKYRCTICNRPFMDGCRLRAHQTIHQGLKPYPCDICGRSFNRPANMKLHRARHFEQKCSHCEETFNVRRSLTKHLKEVHGFRTQKQHKQANQKGNNCSVCRFCGKQLATYDSLLAHERIHTGDKPFICDHCGKSFRTYTGRWHHVLRHEAGNYVCEHCGKTYSSKPNLSRHLQIHVPVEERKYQCTDCGKKFYWKRHLDVHVRVHTGARPYTCDICQFSFTQQGDLKRHRVRHLKESWVRKNEKSKNISLVIQ